jgi:hypothetical protein
MLSQRIDADAPGLDRTRLDVRFDFGLTGVAPTAVTRRFATAVFRQPGLGQHVGVPMVADRHG